MATLHLQTAGLSSSSSRIAHPSEADYAAITPTAARPHPEKGYTSLFDAFVHPPYEQARPSYGHIHEEAQPTLDYPISAGISMMGGQRQPPYDYSQIKYNNNHAAERASSSCSEDTESSSTTSSIGTGGPQTPPQTASGRASPASSFASVPGNTIYTAYTQQQGHAMPGSFAAYPAFPATSHAAMVANHPAYVHAQQQCITGASNNIDHATTHAATQYPAYPSPYYTNQYAIYNGNGTNGPHVIQPVHAMTQQVSPNVAYDTQIGDQANFKAYDFNGTASPLLISDNMDASTMPQRAPHPEMSYQPLAYQPSQDHQYRNPNGHSHSASQSSISTSSLYSGSGSPAPSLSGSDDSGNTSKSTVSHLSAAGLVRSNPSSRRGSISTSSNASTPYATGNSRKDGEKKFVCSYPGCTKAFSRNFNLSTHYNTHLGVKPFPCTYCPKSFSRRHDCARHIGAVHLNDNGKKGQSTNYSHASKDEEDNAISPNTCGCGHTCPAHKMSKIIPSFSTSTFDDTLRGEGTSAFALIKGSINREDDDLFSCSTSSSGYESTTSSSAHSFDSAAFNFASAGNFYMTDLIGGAAHSRSPSVGTLSNASLDFGLVKIEDDGEGE